MTAIGFGVRSNPNITNAEALNGADWSDNQYNSGTTWVKVYADENDTVRQTIFSSNTLSKYDLID